MNVIDFDIALFFQINQVWTSPILDILLPFCRDKFFWAPLYLFLSSFFLINFKRKGLWVILCLLGTVTVSDFVSSKVIKPLVQRERPCNNVELAPNVRNLIRCGPGKSFTSSHAANHFAIAIFLAVIFGRKRRWIWLVGISWAALISYSQVYVGVHFPLDVLSGGILGTIIGMSMAKFCRNFIDLPFIENYNL